MRDKSLQILFLFVINIPLRLSITRSAKTASRPLTDVSAAQPGSAILLCLCQTLIRTDKQEQDMKIHIVCPVDQIPESNNEQREDEMFGNVKSIAYLSFHSTRFRNVINNRERDILNRSRLQERLAAPDCSLESQCHLPPQTFHNLVCEAFSITRPDLTTFTYLLEWLHISDPCMDRDRKGCKQ